MQLHGMNGDDAPLEVTSLQQFYSLMSATGSVRRRLVQKVLKNEPCSEQDIAFLRKSLELLNAVPHLDEFSIRVKLDQTRTIDIDISYEVQELQKDLIFLERGEDALYRHFRTIHEGFDREVELGISRLKEISFRNLISDRDGTVNNYCGRYLSSIQSVYNAVFLSSYAQKGCEHATILTSAPLSQGGLVDISTAPENLFIYAGSKGREYHAPDGNWGNYPIEAGQQEMLDLLNKRISNLVAHPQYEKYTLIGSGFQKKFGQSTIARQDISGSVPEGESLAFLQEIQKLVSEIDSEGRFFRIEDTGKDIEVLLTVSEGSRGLRDFDKGDGVGFLNKALSLLLSEGPNLICGDTPSDIPMLSLSMKENQTSTHACFVTKDPSLVQRVHAVQPHTLIVTQPDVLVTILYELTK